MSLSKHSYCTRTHTRQSRTAVVCGVDTKLSNYVTSESKVKCKVMAVGPKRHEQTAVTNKNSAEGSCIHGHANPFNSRLRVNVSLSLV